MKKCLIILQILVLLMLLTACGGGDTALEITDEQRAALELVRADFDFLIETLKEDFSFFGVAQRREGHDVLELIEEAWGYVEYNIVSHNVIDTEELTFTVNYFLWHDVAYHLNSIAHFGFAIPNEHGMRDYEREFEAQADIEVIETYIIEEGRIAYINFNTFAHVDMLGMWTINNATARQLRNFLWEVQDYEHLIIDIRQTMGGWNALPLEGLIRPNLSETLKLDFFGFYRNSQLSKASSLYFYSEQHLQFSMFEMPYDSQIRSAAETAEIYVLSCINYEDLKVLDYGFRMQVMLQPFLFEPAFHGQMWLLTSEINFSASDWFANIAKESGLMTLVGTTTGGASGPARISSILPNTGILVQFDVLYITDSKGRALEEFRTEPHYFNREGMDALETVLAIIDERQ